MNDINLLTSNFTLFCFSKLPKCSQVEHLKIPSVQFVIPFSPCFITSSCHQRSQMRGRLCQWDHSVTHCVPSNSVLLKAKPLGRLLVPKQANLCPRPRWKCNQGPEWERVLILSYHKLMEKASAGQRNLNQS